MLFHFRQKTYSITTHKSFLCFCLFFFCIFCALGFWQLHRFQYKKILLHTHQAGLDSVALEGSYANERTFYLQNRFYHGKSGYEVLTPLRIAGDNKLLIIDRGWVEEVNKTIPTINQVVGKQNIVGYKKQLDEYQFILGKNILHPAIQPLVMQKIDIAELSRLTQQAFYPYIIKLDPASAHGFVREWIVTATPPERHRMYAIQWFFMALVLVIAYLSFCTEVVKDSQDVDS